MSDQGPSHPVPTGRLRRYTVEQARELFLKHAKNDDCDSSEEEYVDRDRSSSEEERVELENGSSRRRALPKRAMRKYWSKKEVYNSPLFTKLFSNCKRYVGSHYIFSSMLHVGNKDFEGKEKIEPFLNDLVTNFNKVYYPFQNLSLDEMVIGFTGRWQFKQYNASKPKKYHIKSFGIVDATTGYLLNILVYFGSGTSYDPAADVDGSMAVKVFQTLLQNVGSGHHMIVTTQLGS
ncbi:PiggyBac transposable element-derived protein 4 [Elysia marginata]|uniref:PiggyBac transposable element-derived protein 4 n=1 Tax=Elysia marginata TaxID=1093978 RepID=A0AAV4FV67_9GAST|nr:PiggyBac transposable element-derived protein 4 [Elysia marginata]